MSNKTSNYDPLGVLHIMFYKGRLRPNGSLPAHVLWGSFVTHSFLPHGRLANEPQRTSAGRLLEWGISLRLQIYKREGISLVEVYEREGKFVKSVSRKSQKG